MKAWFNIAEAKTHLSSLLARVSRGEEIVVARAGKAIAKLVPLEAPERRSFGTMQGKVPECFFEPLPEEELAAWE